MRPAGLHYVDQRFASVEREIATRHDLAEAELDRRITALQDTGTAAFTEIKHRMDGMNEFRAALADQYARAVTRDDFDHATAALTARLELLIEAVAARVAVLEKAGERARGRQLAYASIAAVFGALVTVFILIASHVHVK